jgi:hypothetical protein
MRRSLDAIQSKTTRIGPTLAAADQKLSSSWSAENPERRKNAIVLVKKACGESQHGFRTCINTNKISDK